MAIAVVEEISLTIAGISIKGFPVGLVQNVSSLRCKYCDSPTHGVNACMKLQKKERVSGQGANNSNAPNAAGQTNDK